MATPVEEVEKAVAQLPPDQQRQFRAWYEEFASEVWDDQIEKDIAAGRLDALAETAIADHKAGKTKRL